jgi:hypothetical protein
MYIQVYIYIYIYMECGREQKGIQDIYWTCVIIINCARLRIFLSLTQELKISVS